MGEKKEEGTIYINFFRLEKRQKEELIETINKTIEPHAKKIEEEGNDDFGLSECFEEGEVFTVVGGVAFKKC